MHQGFGDNLYARPYVQSFVRKHKIVAVETPFPQLFDNVLFIRPQGKLLPLQEKNVALNEKAYAPEGLKFDETITLVYPNGMKEGKSICQSLDTFIDPEPFGFALKPKPEWIEAGRARLPKSDMPVCLVKFPTIRRDFNIPSRNPKIEYFKTFMARNSFFYYDITHTSESEHYEERTPEIDRAGELTVEELIGLTALADLVLFSPSYMLPLSVALRTKAFCIFGGYVSPDLLLDPRMGLERFKYVAPYPFCNCQKRDHACDKEIDERLIPRLLLTR